jgi:predicted 3-demethylubiquinone-9 3-methyltransferase (glyoxalase superfamily)
MESIKSSQNIVPFLWFDGKAEEAMKLYTSLFPKSKIITSKKWSKDSSFNPDWIMMGTIEIDGLKVHMFDAGPEFKFNESVSFFVTCKDQQEVDKYWNALTADGGQESQCGWLKDRFGFSWQIVPAFLSERLTSGEPKRLGHMMQAMMKMRKMIVADLEAAYNR